MKKLIIGLAAAMTMLVLTAGAGAAETTAVDDGRIQAGYTVGLGYYEKPFVEQTGEGWEPAVQQSDGTWSQRYVHDGVAEYAGYYSGLKDAPYPYPNNIVQDQTVTWIPQWGAWYTTIPGERFLDTIYYVGGSGSRVRDFDGQVTERFRPLPVAQEN